MKICIVGLGSIGKKHIKNIARILSDRKINHTIDLFRTSNSLIPDEIGQHINMVYHEVEKVPSDYDAVFITNPTIFHYESIKLFARKTKHMFIEKPLFDSATYHLRDLMLDKDNIYYVACPLRHKEIIQYTKSMIDKEEKIISARCICSSYLPNWRPEVDYRNVYSAKKSLGGGVTIDLIHEWDYLTYLFGFPEVVQNFNGKYSNLEIDSDDISVYIAKYKDKLVEVHLDYIGQKSVRKLELISNERYIEADLLKNEIVIYRNNQIENRIQFHDEDFYMAEMSYFFDCILKNKSVINTVDNAYKVLELALNSRIN